MWELHPKGVHRMHLKIFLYGDHSPKDYKISTMVFTIISTFYFFKAFYWHMILLQVLIELTTWNYWIQIINQKFQFLSLIYLKERNGWIINHIHLRLFLMYQTNHQVSLITFHPSMDRFYIIWSLRFDQVHTLDLLLLQTQNSYLKGRKGFPFETNPEFFYYAF
jgi:hypothetical protein